MEELIELAHSAGIDVVHGEIQHRKKVDPKLIIGKGKARELLIMSIQLGVDLIIFDNNARLLHICANFHWPGQLRI